MTLGALALLVERAERGGDLFRALFVVRQKKLDGVTRMAEAARGVESGPDPESDRLGVHAGAGARRAIENGAETGEARARARREPEARDDAVLVDERHDVGDGPDRGER